MFKFHLWQNFLLKIKLWKNRRENVGTKNLFLKEGNFMGKVLTHKEELDKAYKLRYKIFCKELKWLPLNKEEKDIDKYDEYSIHFGVFSSEKLVAYSRIVLPDRFFMLEEVFKDLLPENYSLRKEKDTVEISRVAIDQPFRSSNNSEIIKLLLFKLMYQWSIKNEIRYWYMTLQPDYLKSIQKLFPCKQIGKVKFYQPGVASVAALLDLREAEVFVQK
jgi:acyl homoserine lactone synthase